MKLSNAIFGSALIVAIAITIASLSPAESQRRQSGYMIASDGGQFVWRVNTTTGSISYCVRRDDSTDKGFIAGRAPYCSAGTPALTP